MNNDEGRFLYNYLQVYVTPEKGANRKRSAFSIQPSALSIQLTASFEPAARSCLAEC
jgi:hypothetical protein